MSNLLFNWLRRFQWNKLNGFGRNSLFVLFTLLRQGALQLSWGRYPFLLFFLFDEKLTLNLMLPVVKTIGPDMLTFTKSPTGKTTGFLR